MGIRILAVGKKHEPWVTSGIERYEKRLRKPFDVTWRFMQHSAQAGTLARNEESGRLREKIGRDDFVMLLDERGKEFDSPGVASMLRRCFDSGRPVTLIIGGAYGVSEELRAQADAVWSLSPLVFPHQLVRLITIEQIYRAQEISAGRQYHHR